MSIFPTFLVGSYFYLTKRRFSIFYFYFHFVPSTDKISKFPRKSINKKCWPDYLKSIASGAECHWSMRIARTECTFG